MELFKVLFILKFLYMKVCTEEAIYDNSAHTPAADENVTSCQFVKTEHFVVETTDNSARMHLSTEKLFHTILEDLKFLVQIEPKSVFFVKNQWFTEDIFKNIFQFSQIQETDFSQSTHMCNQYLYLRKGNSSVCKLGRVIHFNDNQCSSLISNPFPFKNWSNNSFVTTLAGLSDDTVYTFIDRGQRIKFIRVNDITSTCKVKIDLDYLSTWRNVYIGTATVFSSYEHLLQTFYPKPPCQILKFNFPTEIIVDIPLYNEFPRILAKFLDANLRVPATCILLKHEASAQPMPSLFLKALSLFSRVFGSVPSFPRTRVKRDSFSRFFEYVFGDASSRLKTLEYARRRDVKMQNYLLDKSNITDLAIRHDEEVLSNLYKDVKIEQYLVMDLILRLDLERLSNNFHEQFSISLNKLRSFHTNHQSLLLEFRSAFEHDIEQLTSCVRSQSFCFHQHEKMHCTEDCFLSVADNFYINFKLLSYKKLEIYHASCLHTLAGHISILDNEMFVKNATHFKSISKDINVPIQCSEQTLENNIECKAYFMPSNDQSILQCRNDQIFATGNISYLNPRLQSIGLTFVPTVISKLDFPINLSNKQLFSDEICGTEDVFLRLPRKKFETFLRISPSFLLNQDVINSTSFEINFIHKTLKSFQKVKAQEVIKIAQSGTFLLSCFLAIMVFCSCLSICFCPALFISLLQCILSSMIRFFTYILEKIIHLIHLFINMLCNMYDERTVTRLNSETPITNDQNEAQNMLNTAAEQEPSFSPISEISSASIVDVVQQPGVRNESTTRRALRFINLPLQSPIRLRTERSSQPERDYFPASAPSPTPIYRDLPGTPKKLF